MVFLPKTNPAINSKSSLFNEQVNLHMECASVSKANEIPISWLMQISGCEHVFYIVNIYFEIYIYKPLFTKEKRKYFSEKLSCSLSYLVT